MRTYPLELQAEVKAITLVADECTAYESQISTRSGRWGDSLHRACTAEPGRSNLRSVLHGSSPRQEIAAVVAGYCPS